MVSPVQKPTAEDGIQKRTRSKYSLESVDIEELEANFGNCSFFCFLYSLRTDGLFACQGWELLEQLGEADGEDVAYHEEDNEEEEYRRFVQTLKVILSKDNLLLFCSFMFSGLGDSFSIDSKGGNGWRSCQQRRWWAG